MSHSTRPAWANEGAVWRHCRRCGARPFIPSKPDPAMCEDCAEEYQERGLRYCNVGKHWRPAVLMVPRYARCKPCRNALRRVAYDGSAAQATRRAYYEANREREIAYAKVYQRQHRRAYERRRYHSDPEWRAKKLAIAARWKAAHPERMRELEAQRRYRRKLKWLRGMR